MGPARRRTCLVAAIATIASAWLHGCSGRGPAGPAIRASTDERDCLVRAMYFESQRSSHEGLLAVGTVVMNRVSSTRFPNTICGVVGQRRQFARGVLTRGLDPRQAGPAKRAADAVLKGERYAPVGRALHFHAASYKNPYPATYVTVAGGNAFYLRKGSRWRQAYTGSVSSPAPSASAQSLYRRATAVVAGGQAANPCETLSGPGALSLACETNAEHASVEHAGVGHASVGHASAEGR